MVEIILHPSAAVEAVCHDEQMTVWSNDVAGALSMGSYLRDDLSYDEVLDLTRCLEQEIRRIVHSALSHPEAQTFIRPRDRDNQ